MADAQEPNAFATVNAASFARDKPLAPGCLVAGFGTDLAETSQAAQATPLPRQLAGTKVLVNGEEAPLLFVSPSQINYVLPDLTSRGTATAEVVHAGQRIATSMLLVWDVSPALFSRAGNGYGQGTILNDDWSANSPENPAQRGKNIHIYGTGAGRVVPRVAAGVSAPAEPLSRTLTRPQVYVGGQPAEVLFSGLAPGLVAIWQIDAIIPSNVTPTTTTSLRVSLQDRDSNFVTLAVR